MLSKLKTYVSPWDVLRSWPEEMPICFFGGTSSRYSILATSLSEVSFSEFLDKPFCSGNAASELPFQKGYVGLISYDEFSSQSVSTSRVFKVSGALVFDEKKQSVYLSSDGSSEEFSLSQDKISALFEAKPRKKPANWTAEIAVDRSDDSYLKMTASAIEEIRNGRFYQINLLRYFKVQNPPLYQELVSRMEKYSGPQAAWFKTNDLEVISFSPERFIETRVENDALIALTQPIKGTSPRHDNPVADKRSADELVASEKDNAELHMIVDLMRNDLNRVSQSQSVKVLDEGSLHSFANVHHLIASISSRLKSDLTVGSFLRAVCPGGSITGAPKQEVMSAIRESEGRDRGFFMGNAFYLDDSGHFDSSILIRTLVATGENTYEFAAGSGIVVGSDPQLELTEVDAKCRVITWPF